MASFFLAENRISYRLKSETETRWKNIPIQKLRGTANAVNQMPMRETVNAVNHMQMRETANVVNQMPMRGTANAVTQTKMRGTANAVTQTQMRGTANAVTQTEMRGTANAVSQTTIQRKTTETEKTKIQKNVKKAMNLLRLNVFCTFIILMVLAAFFWIFMTNYAENGKNLVEKMVSVFPQENFSLTPAAQETSTISQKATTKGFIQLQNQWNCHSELLLMDQTVMRKGEKNGWRSCRGKTKISRKIGLFYYEVTVKNCSTCDSDIAIGLAGASMPKKGKMVGDYPGSYAYVSNGTFRGHTVHNEEIFSNEKPKFEIDYIVGVGVNLTTRQLFYTNIGRRLDILDLQLDIAAGLYPAVSMNGPFDTIEANFGPNFEYKLSQEDGADVK